MGIGPLLSERTDPGHNQAGIDLLQYRITDMQGIHVPRRKAFDHEISPFYQPPEDLATVGCFDVERYAPLIGIIGKPEETFFPIGNILIEGTERPAGRA